MSTFCPTRIFKPEVQQEMDKVLAGAYDEHIVNFGLICERLSATLYMSDFKDPDVSGMVEIAPFGGFNIYLNRKHHKNRQRFTFAHEIGHIISFKAGSYSKEKLEREGYVERNTLLKATDFAEFEANDIAAEILMPSLQLEGMLNTQQNPSVTWLAKEFGVSEAAMSVRLSKLGYILS